jgi:hypothetical protein
MKTRLRSGWFWLVAVLLVGAVYVLGNYAVWIKGRHKHCIVAAWLSLKSYASDHGGSFPSHTNGYGDALVVWAKASPGVERNLVGPGDDGRWLREAVATGDSVDENLCSRIYVQGLEESSYPRIAVLFDRFATRGGDHSPHPWAGYLREACLLDGSMVRIPVARWSAFASNQVQLLVQAGIPRATAEAYYRPALDRDAQR